MEDLCGNHVPVLCGVCRVGSSVHVVTAMHGVDLRTEMQTWIFTPVEVGRIVLHLATAVSYLHSRGVAHNQICPRHCIRDPDTGSVVLADLSLAACGAEDALAIRAADRWGEQDWPYLPLDVLMGGQLDSPCVDVWGLGTVTAELAAGASLFHADDVGGVIAKILHICGPPPDAATDFWTKLPNFQHMAAERQGLPNTILEYIGQDGVDLLHAAFHLCVAERSTAAELLTMPYLAKQAAPSDDASAVEPALRDAPSLPSAAAPAGYLTFGLRSAAPGSNDVAAEFLNALNRDGFVVVKGLVPEEDAVGGASAIKERTEELLRGYGASCSPDFRELFAISASLTRAPDCWPGINFGAVDKRGWIQKVGNGRMFDGWDNSAIDACRECTRPLVAAWHNCDPSELEPHPERCSVKPPGSSMLGAHLDRQRVDTLQALGLSGQAFQVSKLLPDNQWFCWARGGPSLGRPGRFLGPMPAFGAKLEAIISD